MLRLVEEDREPSELVRALLEGVGRRLECARGRWVVELVFEDGRLVKLYRHHGPVSARELDESFGAA